MFLEINNLRITSPLEVATKDLKHFKKVNSISWTEVK